MPSVIIVAGPTASGKSDYTEKLARSCNGEIINADSVQMFAPLAVGTAKPDWKSSDIPHHLFDICNQPRDFDVTQYRARVEQLVSDIKNRCRTPILVGGSLFYIKSLFYPPKADVTVPTGRKSSFTDLSNEEMWQKLHEIDSERAEQIHANDRYRVERALIVWEATGKKPSTFKPQYEPLFKSEIRFLSPPLETLYTRINARTIKMITEMGWIDEARRVYADDAWREFVSLKKFIGYPELFEWIGSGEPADELPMVITKIQQVTRHYAKRQRTFWRSFCEQVQRDGQEDSSGDMVRVTSI